MSRTAARCTCVHLRVYLALLPSGPDAVRRLKLHRVRAAVRPTRLPDARRALQQSSLTYVLASTAGLRGPPYAGWRYFDGGPERPALRTDGRCFDGGPKRPALRRVAVLRRRA